MTRYMMAATDAGGERLGERVASPAPTLGEVAEFGGSCRTNYVSVCDDRDHITLYGRDAVGSWSVIAAGVDVETAEEVRLWFDLAQHYRGRVVGRHRRPGRPPSRPRLDAGKRADGRGTGRLACRGADPGTRPGLPHAGAGGGSLRSGLERVRAGGRRRERSDGVSGHAGGQVGFSGERRGSGEGDIELGPSAAGARHVHRGGGVRSPPAGRGRVHGRLQGRGHAARSASEGSAVIAAFTVDDPYRGDRGQGVLAARRDRAAARPARPAGLAALRRGVLVHRVRRGRPLQFWTDRPMDVQPVPEQIAVLVRRHRHLAARMPAGPWWRLLLTVSDSAAAR